MLARFVSTARLPSAQRRFLSSLIPDCNYVSELHRGATRYPNRAALIDGTTGTSFSYADLRRATLNVASGLVKMGFGRGHTLALITHNRPEFVFASHGAIAAGGTASPLNCHSTAAELRHPLTLSDASIVVTDRQRLPAVRQAMASAPSVRHVFLIGESEAGAAALGCSAFEQLLEDDGRALSDFVEVEADTDVAFLPFSSGTTGLPKGVMLSHNNVSANLRQSRHSLRNPEAQEVTLGVLPFYHIYALNVSLGNTLHNGGTVVTMPHFDPESFLRLIEAYAVSVLHLVPPLALFLVQSPLVDQFRLSSVLRVMSGAAPLGLDTEREVDERVARFHPDAKFFQGYGLTETSPFTHANVCYSGETKRLGSIGPVVPGLECRIVDVETRQEMAVGETGEVAMKGPNIMKGYLKRPADTAACLDDDGWFFSGDVGRQDEDGYFYITDRAKELIKFKGLQVAPAELEAALLSHPKILDCAVIGKPDERAGELPLAFVVRQSDDLDASHVHDHLSRLLSDHKQLRGGIRFVSKIPKSPSGKILRRELRESLSGGS